MDGPRQSTAYVERSGANATAVGVLLAGLASTMVVIMLSDVPPLAAIAGLLLFGVGGLALLLFHCLHGAVAFRADERGVVPEDVLAPSRPVIDRQLDEEKPNRIMAVHAPHVRLVRLAGGRPGPDRERPAGEGFLARQRRLLIKADFRRNEMVTFARGSLSLEDYLSDGPRLRSCNRMWNLIVATSGLPFLIALVIIVTGNSNGTSVWWTIPFILAFCYCAWYHFAGWRCMRRHR